MMKCCDSVFIGGTAAGSFNPWLVLGISASPNPILPNGTSNLTADLTHNSNGGSGFSIPNGVSLAFGNNALLGTISGASATLTNGLGTALYTAGPNPGNDNVTASVDNATASTTINIEDTVTFDTAPTGLSYTVDSITHTTPQTFNWIVGSSHSFSTTSPQNVSAGQQYAWASWSTGGPISQTVSAPQRPRPTSPTSACNTS